MPIYIWLKDLSDDKQKEILEEYGDGYRLNERPVAEIPTKDEINRQLQGYLLELQRQQYLNKGGMINEHS